MDIESLRIRARESRQFSVSVAGLPNVLFSLELVTRHAARVMAMRFFVSGVSNAEAAVLAERAQLEACITGWRGLTVSDVVRSHDVAHDAAIVDEPIEYSTSAVRLLLDERPDVADQLAEEWSRRMRARAERFEAAEKNSESISSGSETGTRRDDSASAVSRT